MKPPILCYVTDRTLLSPSRENESCERLLGCIERAANAGIEWIQIREKSVNGRALFDLTARAVALSSPAIGNRSTSVFVNDRLDVAITAHAAGVHLGESSLPLAEAVRWRSQARSGDFVIGVSCHSL